MVKDPVCGMSVDKNTAKWKSEYQGETYYFCNERCKLAFDKQPSRFVK
jgi:Cu+-exporting ATPase